VDLLHAARVEGEVIVVSDGSTDGTAAAARSVPGGLVRVIEFPDNRGKAVALAAAAAAARHDILVFADARQRWDPSALGHLLQNFADPGVGAVSGELVLESAPGVLAGVGLYWRFEKWLRRQESAARSMVGVTGAISAVRRELFRPPPPGTILDDVYWPLRVAMQGARVVFEARARAFDRLPEKTRDEFRRKVRTLAGNFQLLTLLPAALLPWRNPIWWQFVSHKLLRLAVPWALLGLLVSAAALPGAGYRAAFAAQVAAYLLALHGIWGGSGAGRRLAAAAAAFLVMNAAAWAAFWVWAGGRTARSWTKVSYQDVVPVNS
jgi:cellulose synthase/poly-beta-1,6-N-acetylglucosamine synthase-like glycosyltransferase